MRYMKKKFNRITVPIIMYGILCTLSSRHVHATNNPLAKADILSAAALLEKTSTIQDLFDALSQLPIPEASSFATTKNILKKRSIPLNASIIHDELIRARNVLILHASVIGKTLTTELTAITDHLLSLSKEQANDTRAPRPPIDTGDAPATGPVGTQNEPITTSSCTLPANVTIAHDLDVINDLTVHGNATVKGTIYAEGETRCTNGNPLIFESSTPGNYIGFRASPATTVSSIWTLPINNGTAGQVLTTNGNDPATLSWSTIAIPANAYVDGGNDFGGDATIGLTTDNILQIITGAGPSTRLTIAGDSGGGTITTHTALYADGGIDTSSPATLNIGTTNTNNISAGNATATINITGSSIALTGTTTAKNGGAIHFERNGFPLQYVGFRAQNAAITPVIWQLPTADGVNGSVLSTDGAGTLSWISAPTPPGTYANTGNNFGGDALLGLSDNYDLNIITNNKTRVSIDNVGNTTYTSNYKACAYLSADYITGSSPITVTFDTESFDPNNNFASNIYTAPVDGTYMVTAEVCILVGNNGAKTIKIYKGAPGAAIPGCTGRIFVPTYTTTLNGTDTYTIPLVTFVNLVAGDVIRIVYSGDPLDTVIADGTQFGVHLMSVTPTP